MWVHLDLWPDNMLFSGLQSTTYSNYTATLSQTYLSALGMTDTRRNKEMALRACVRMRVRAYIFTEYISGMKTL